MLNETDLMPCSLDDLERRLREHSFESDELAQSYWYDYLWDADVFDPPGEECGEEMWERVCGELGGLLGGEHELNPEQAWVLASAAFAGCGAERHERLWPQGEDGFVEGLERTSQRSQLLERAFLGLRPPAAGNLTPSVRREVSFGWLRAGEIQAAVEDESLASAGSGDSWDGLVAVLRRCAAEGSDLFVAADGRP